MDKIAKGSRKLFAWLTLLASSLSLEQGIADDLCQQTFCCGQNCGQGNGNISLRGVVF